MNKLMTMATLATLISAPVLANDKMGTDEKAQKMTEYCLSKADTNNDGMMSKAEAQAMNDKMFSMADKNNDGSVSKDEMVAAKKMEIEDMKAMKDGTGMSKAGASHSTSTMTHDSGTNADTESTGDGSDTNR